jgi:hypothetical protein
MKIETILKLNSNRNNPLLNGYFGVISFKNIDWNASCKVDLINKSELKQCEESFCEIEIIVKDSIDFLSDKLFIGLEFELKEGKRIVGNGIIFKIKC